MLKKEDLFKLGKLAINAQSSAPVAYSFGDEKYSYEDLMNTFREELNQYAGTYNLYRQNKNMIFELMEELIDDVLPKKVLEQYGQFAEVKTYAQGDKPIFTQRITQASRRRAQQFVTKVGLAGVYEVFKLDGQSYEIPTSAYGGAAQIGFEEMLDGRITMSDVLDIILEGIDRCVYIEIERALKSAVDSLQGTNKHSTSGFVEAQFDRLLSIADSYGGKSTIYCTYEFAALMVPATGWISDAMRDAKWNNGYLGNYKGHNVVILAQSFEDETNTTKVIDPSYAWIIPTGGGNEKPVRVAFEGQAIVREYENRDLSREVQIYKKMGVGAIITNNICVYRNTDLTR
jgi:hypothetical protein